VCLLYSGLGRLVSDVFPCCWGVLALFYIFLTSVSEENRRPLTEIRLSQKHSISHRVRARIIVDYVAADGKTENITQTRKRKERERKGKDRKKFISNHAYSRKSIPNCRF